MRTYRWLSWVAKLRRQSPLKFWLSAGLITAVLSGLGTITYVRHATVRQHIAYPPCELQYGQEIGSWHGNEGSDWNDEHYYYVVKKYAVHSEAPATLWANAIEDPPTVIDLTNPEGSLTCQPVNNEETQATLVDTTTAAYRWEGARAVAVRLGVPDLGPANQNGQINVGEINTKVSDEQLAVIAKEHSNRAAAWVDDGGQAVIKNKSGQPAQLLWCQNFNRPLNPKEACGDISSYKPSLAGAGYLFTADNCPSGFGNCADRAGWHQNRTDFTKLVGTNGRGELQPFNLYLSAVSTYGYGVGTGMSMTFKYPKVVDLSNSLSLSQKTLKAGDTLIVSLSLGKLGPDLTSLSVEPSVEGQPLTLSQDFGLGQQQLAQLNQAEELKLTAKFKVAQNPQPGSCYNLTVKFKGQSRVKVAGSNQVSIPELTAKYCIAQPQTSTLYTYDVSTKGTTKASFSEFKIQAAQTLASTLGWAKAGVSFRAVASGGDFSLVLASPDQMTSFSSGCDATYSCRAGRYVIINDERWRQATHSWNQAGGSLRDYRHMVINHEVGHWLGFGHLNCPAAGAGAPVMQQQSISLQGCKFNSWPTPAEINTLKARL